MSDNGGLVCDVATEVPGGGRAERDEELRTTWSRRVKDKHWKTGE